MHMEKITPPPSSPRVAALLRTVALFERNDIENAVDSLIALLDARDGDPDLEPDGDEQDASYPEDASLRARVIAGKATPIEDAEDDDAGEDDDPDTCQAGDDGTGWFMTFHGLRSGSEWDDDDRELDEADGEGFTWPEAMYQPSNMAGGIVTGLHDEAERADVSPQWPIAPANDDDRAAA